MGIFGCLEWIGPFPSIMRCFSEIGWEKNRINTGCVPQKQQHWVLATAADDSCLTAGINAQGRLVLLVSGPCFTQHTGDGLDLVFESASF